MKSLLLTYNCCQSSLFHFPVSLVIAQTAFLVLYPDGGGPVAACTVSDGTGPAV